MSYHGPMETIGEHRATLGEGPAWDAISERLLFVDIHGETVHELARQADGWGERSFAVGEPVGAVVPRAHRGFVLATASGFRLVDEQGALEQVIDVEADRPHNRMNDAKVDPQGRLWAGTLSTRREPAAGALYRLDLDLSVERVLDDVDLANGLDWSPDGETFYFIDTSTRGVDAFDFDGETGTISRRRRLLTFGPELVGAPDGMAVDTDGGLWIAAPLDGQVRHYNSVGRLLGILRTPVTDVTSCAFGSADGGDLFITSGRMITPEFIELFGFPSALLDRVATERDRGAVLRCRPGVTGPPARRFGG
jgi:sugar lactone lactonase YvrE